MKQQSVARGFAVLSLAGILVKILSLLYIPFLLAIIGEEGNGIYAAAYQVYVLIYVISNTGIPVAISKLVSELTATGNPKDALRSFKIARFLLILSGIASALIMLLLAGNISTAMHFEKSRLAIMALAPTFLFTSIASAYRGYFQGNGNMVPTAVSQVAEQIANTIFTLVFAALFLKYGIEAACAGGTIGTSIGALIAAVILITFYNRQKIHNPVAQNQYGAVRYTYGSLIKKVTGYSVPITLCIGMQYAGNLIDVANTKVRLLAAGFDDAAATEMYSHLYKYQQLLNAPIAVVAALAATILPAVSAAVAVKNRALVENRVNFAFRLCFLITIPSAAGFSVLSTPVFKLLKYGPGAYLMLVGSIALVMLAIVQVQTSILQGSGRLYTVTIVLIFGIIGKIATNYLLIAIPSINILGAIAGSITGYVISISLNNLVIKKVLKTRFKFIILTVKPLISSVLMGLVVYLEYSFLNRLFNFAGDYLANAAALLISASSGVFLYFVLMLAIKGIGKEDLEVLPSRITRLIPKAFMDRMVQ